MTSGSLPEVSASQTISITPIPARPNAASWRGVSRPRRVNKRENGEGGRGAGVRAFGCLPVDWQDLDERVLWSSGRFEDPAEVAEAAHAHEAEGALASDEALAALREKLTGH